jgi:hypothetical protein
MPKAFIETTVLTDVLLKKNHESGNQASAALRRFTETELPVYAIKEFQGGPLKNFIWFHNVLAVNGSFSRSLTKLHKMALTPRRYTTATAIEALRGAAETSLNDVTLKDLSKQYGALANPDVVLAERFRLSLKANIFRGWRQRRRVTTSVVEPLSCYAERGIEEDQGLLSIAMPQCAPTRECCLAPLLRDRINQLQKLREILKSQDQKPENVRRGKVLRALHRTPKREMNVTMCRDLGDAYFALFAPQNSTILSTNLRDIDPLATALGKRTERP